VPAVDGFRVSSPRPNQPLTECLVELRNCGRRFVEFLERNLHDQEAWQSTIDDLRFALGSRDGTAPPEEKTDPDPLSPEEIGQILAENTLPPDSPAQG
jgi:hypothetical protein